MAGSLSVRHAGIVVRNIEKARSFYTAVLGLEDNAIMMESGPFIDAVLGGKGVAVQTIKLKAMEGETLVELLHFQVPVSDKGGGEYPFNRPGPTHLAFTVTGLAELVEAVCIAGGKKISAPKLSVDGRVRVAFCRDPEGNLLELVEPVSNILSR